VCWSISCYLVDSDPSHVPVYSPAGYCVIWHVGYLIQFTLFLGGSDFACWFKLWCWNCGFLACTLPCCLCFVLNEHVAALKPLGTLVPIGTSEVRGACNYLCSCRPCADFLFLAVPFLPWLICEILKLILVDTISDYVSDLLGWYLLLRLCSIFYR
jgi:hypothetical protein